jgi:hypothetical protein
VEGNDIESRHFQYKGEQIFQWIRRCDQNKNMRFFGTTGLQHYVHKSCKKWTKFTWKKRRRFCRIWSMTFSLAGGWAQHHVAGWNLRPSLDCSNRFCVTSPVRAMHSSRHGHLLSTLFHFTYIITISFLSTLNNICIWFIIESSVLTCIKQVPNEGLHNGLAYILIYHSAEIISARKWNRSLKAFVW